MNRRATLVLSVLLLSVAGAGVSARVRRFAWSIMHKDKQSSGLRPRDLDVGDQMCLPEGIGGRSEQQRRVYIVSKRECPACALNLSFEELLHRRCTTLGIPVAYVVPEDQTQDERAAGLRTMGREVVRADLGALGVRRVPSVMALDERGVVTSVWQGSVPDELAEAVLELVTRGSGAPLAAPVDVKTAQSVAKQGGAQVLAVRELSGRVREWEDLQPIIIPLTDLGVRASYELRKDAPIIVYCQDGHISAFECQEAVLILDRLRFRPLFVLGSAGRRASAYCSR